MWGCHECKIGSVPAGGRRQEVVKHRHENGSNCSECIMTPEYWNERTVDVGMSRVQDRFCPRRWSSSGGGETPARERQQLLRVHHDPRVLERTHGRCGDVTSARSVLSPQVVVVRRW